MSFNLPLIRRSRRGRGGRKLEINIPPQQNSKGVLINEGGVMSSEYGMLNLETTTTEPYQNGVWCLQ